MLDAFLFVGLPYLALTVLVIGTIWRFRSQRFGVSSLSSQLLESRSLPLGSIPWHVGIIVLLLGHLIPVLVPGVWAALVSNRVFLYTVEAIGLAAALLAAFGLVVLIVRRLRSALLQQVTSTLDLIVLALLLAQVVLGIVVASQLRWGAMWSSGTTTPYLWSLVTLRPELGLAADLPGIVKLHLSLAFIIFLLVPVTRLVHAFSIPLGYLTRAPQKVVWATSRRVEALRHAGLPDPEANRRTLLKGGVGVAAAAGLLSIGVLDKLLRFLRGGDVSRADKQTLMAMKVERLQLTTQERELELERMQSDTIFVGRLGDLKERSGQYFIDYQMRPALAFRDEGGLPLLISAKCTHLGCTVASQMDEQGRILCPCHISYFDVKTGEPNAGAPAKVPLPHIGWVLTDVNGATVASRAPGGPVEGTPDPARLDDYKVFIARKFEEETAASAPRRVRSIRTEEENA